MRLSEVLREAKDVAAEFGLGFVEVDRTAHTLSLRMYVDRELFFHVYVNDQKRKLNLALVLRGERIYGYDKEGGRYHMHPFENPDMHVFTDTEKPLRKFVMEAMTHLEEKGLL